MRNHDVQSTVISAGQSSSAFIDVGMFTLCIIHMPPAFTGGYLEFDIGTSITDTARPLKDSSGNAIRYTAAAGTAVSVNRADFTGAQFIKFRAVDSGGANQNQVQDAIILAVAAEL